MAGSSLPVQPGGTITMSIDGRIHLPAVTLASGLATVAIPALSVGNHELKVEYSGDTYFLPASGTPASVAVTAPSVPTVPTVPTVPAASAGIPNSATFGNLAYTGSNGPAFAGLGLGGVAALVLGLLLWRWSRQGHIGARRRPQEGKGRPAS
ncbi:Ig-like domain-containing protein [Arthrobacter bambusae]|uniref:Ig-like domain-containing protein n=1 Tax=Arthrobacter bambusae TaxID=1338426 RepID=UPI0035230CA9